MRVTICDTRKELGRLAAAEGASYIKAAIEENGEANVVFVTGKSQVDTLLNLAKADIDWSCVNVFHLDEFIGLKKDSISSSRYFLQEFFQSSLFVFLLEFCKVRCKFADIIKPFLGIFFPGAQVVFIPNPAEQFFIQLFQRYLRVIGQIDQPVNQIRKTHQLSR